MNEQTMPGTGYLIVRATAAGGAIPLEGATVVVRGGTPETSGVISTRITDRDGRTEKIALPAPPAGNSEVPEGGVPYAAYQIEVSYPGYAVSIYQNVPIFDRVTALQTAMLLPGGDSVRFYESENPLL
ncbi:MAG: hypothetical protein IJC15_06065 [Clostridia bacterium]|nr:hypothetical protein [Clostridia bacterium]